MQRVESSGQKVEMVLNMLYISDLNVGCVC